MTTATTEAGKAYGTSCEKYQELSDKKLANSDTLVVCGCGSCIKVDKGALLIKQGFSHEALKCWMRLRFQGSSSPVPWSARRGYGKDFGHESCKRSNRRSPDVAYALQRLMTAYHLYLVDWCKPRLVTANAELLETFLN